MKLSVISALTFITSVFAQVFEFSLYYGTACTIDDRQSGTACYDATCDIPNTSVFTQSGEAPYAFSPTDFETGFSVNLYTATEYAGTYGYIDSAELVADECYYFTADLPILSLEITC